jgi:hypothetical protein
MSLPHELGSRNDFVKGVLEAPINIQLVIELATILHPYNSVD